MSAKQDRVGARTPSDLERKYNFGERFAEIIGIATDARVAAEKAESAVSDLDNELSADEIFNRLTNDGEEQGIYREDGKIYVNASYIKTGEFLADLIKAGVLQSKDGKSFYLDLDNGVLKMHATELTIGAEKQSVEDVAANVASGVAGDRVEQDFANAIGYTDMKAEETLSSAQAYTRDYSEGRDFASATQEDVFNKLTDNGAVHGLFMENGQLYINASYINTGALVANLIKSGALISVNGKTYFDLDKAVFVCKGNSGSATITEGAFKVSNDNGFTLSALNGSGIFFYPTGEHNPNLGPYYSFSVVGDHLYADLVDLDFGDAVVSRKIGFKTINGVKTIVAYD